MKEKFEIGLTSLKHPDWLWRLAAIALPCPALLLCGDSDDCSRAVRLKSKYSQWHKLHHRGRERHQRPSI
jgi:hypothetical protein